MEKIKPELPLCQCGCEDKFSKAENDNCRWSKNKIEDNKFIFIKCDKCGKRFKISKWWLSDKAPYKRRFCSRKCADKWKSENYIIKANYKRICKVCGKDFLTWIGKPKNLKGFYSKSFCSKKCQEKRLKIKVFKENLSLYDTYNKQLSYCEETRRNPKNRILLDVKCTYCGKWFSPKMMDSRNRVMCLNGKQAYGWSEARFYCSNGCKKACPVFSQKLYPKGFKEATSREVQPELRKLVFERDDYQCIICYKENELHCHHLEGVVQNPIESADVDICVTLCKGHHKWVHTQAGCRYFDMRCKK